MASRWMRRLSFSVVRLNAASKQGWPAKAIACFMQHVLGFTFQSENWSGGGSFTDAVKSGSDGALTNSDWTFTDSVAGSFVQDDYHRWLLVADNSNPGNAGLYLITKVVSANQIEVDFATSPIEFPTSASGLSWWIIGEDQDLPADGDYVRLRSRHATQWALQVQHTSGFYHAVKFQMSPDGQWSRILGSIAGGDCPAFSYVEANGSGWNKMYIEADYDGEWFHFWRTQQDCGLTEYEPSPDGFIVARLTETEAGREEIEKTVFCGPADVGYVGTGYDFFGRAFDTNVPPQKYLMARYWDVKSNQQKLAHMVDMSYYGYAEAFVVDVDFDPVHNNRRLGNKLELFDGTYLITDPQNEINEYALLGKMKGHWTMRALPTDPYLDWRYEYRESHSLMVLSVGGTRNRMMVHDGIVVNWPGFSNGEV